MLTNRQLLILQLTVNDFIESAQPVGSRQLSKKPEAPFSPATIRNEMADLEDLGYLEKTHTSSGRIPSEKGYRFYVDHLLTPEKLTVEDSVQIRSVFQNSVVETEELIRNSAKIISELTNYTSILLGPDTLMHSVKKFSIVPLDETKAVAIIVTDNGHVENRIFDVPKGMVASDIEKMVNILNERLVGTPLSLLQNKLAREAKIVFEQHVHHAGDLFASFQRAMTIKPEERLYFGGKMNMMKQPEFNDLQKMKMLFEFMENGTTAFNFFRDDTKGIHVRIGSENELDAMEDCSVITANYSAGPNMSGSIAIIGPKRMDYGRVITMLDILSGNLSQALEKNRK
ncbi:heat-inducible transcriptional repressor HrcA [Sporosarcina thermotolerans]|uniref:Heat-inducible transcription repressor HrcA n=1 Tax=Sporosarcina thermotolerans TaxID=633404 RepID=A0AAW9ABL0_9BACL|nr:heat-inducible transcriptional repressor HrcA [Sporosarcina thermotolerans]MDW0117400.1 heat-inducible transcriptional repressor HrcA [Sporosarcina thermotolerans]WHT47536.1 heat-inducible transcriptional repressor HrcA [Sporosarcina thermotolerans]